MGGTNGMVGAVTLTTCYFLLPLSRFNWQGRVTTMTDDLNLFLSFFAPTTDGFEFWGYWGNRRLLYYLVLQTYDILFSPFKQRSLCFFATKAEGLVSSGPLQERVWFGFGQAIGQFSALRNWPPKCIRRRMFYLYEPSGLRDTIKN